MGIHHQASGIADRGVLIVVGGPQYRVGSHRQFVLLARSLANTGIPVFRFDHRGMGDSEGDSPGFDRTAPDIKAALDAFVGCQPGLEQIVLWGLCDAAAAAMIYGRTDTRVTAMVLLNPWVRTEKGQSKTLLRHYYLRRLGSRDFWRRLVTGRIGIRAAAASLSGNIQSAMGAGDDDYDSDNGSGSFVDRMREGLAGFDGRALFVISGDDLTAAEFMDLIADSPRWRKIMRRSSIQLVRHDAANHTFSSREWRRYVEEQTYEMVRAL